METLKAYKCKSCGGLFLPPIFACSYCGAEDFEEVELKGEGSIYTFTNVYMGYGNLKDKTPYCLALIELDEGLKVLSIVEDINVEKVKIGDRVKLKYFDDANYPIFTGA